MAGLLLISNGWVALIVCAIGNACFHVGGGIDSLVRAKGKMSRSGIFVSSGAIGVVLGTISGKSSISLLLPILLIVASLVLVGFASGRHMKASIEKPITFNTASNYLPFSIVLILCFVSIMIRSYVGSILPIEWKTTDFLFVLPAIGACVGKALGGFIADAFGAQRTGVLTLIVAIPFFIFGYTSPLVCTLGILLFNMSMAITLCAVAAKLPHNPGLAFGITTLGLLCGNIPTFFLTPQLQTVLPIICILTIASAICIFFAVSNLKGESRNEKTV